VKPVEQTTGDLNAGGNREKMRSVLPLNFLLAGRGAPRQLLSLWGGDANPATSLAATGASSFTSVTLVSNGSAIWNVVAAT
jgi:hypothetical protein